MKHELKIILGETPASTKIFVDDQIIGLIQEIKINVNVKNSEIEIVFPDLGTHTSTFTKDLEKYKEIFKEMPYVKITWKNIFEDDK